MEKIKIATQFNVTHLVNFELKQKTKKELFFILRKQLHRDVKY